MILRLIIYYKMLESDFKKLKIKPFNIKIITTKILTHNFN
jgi:hypothetical protein